MQFSILSAFGGEIFAKMNIFNFPIYPPLAEKSSLKRTFLKSALIFLSISSLLILPSSTQAAGLVPCGLPDPNAATPTLEDPDPSTPYNEAQPCGFCHLFVLFNNIVNFLFRLVLPVAALMLMFAGVKFFLAIDNPGEVGRAKDLIKSVIIGLIIIYGAWAFVGAFLSAIGLATWTQNILSSWWTDGLFQINCPTP